MDYFLKKNIFPVHSINSNRATNEYWLNVIPKPLLLRPRSQDLKINEKRWTSKYLPVPHWVRNNGKGMKKRESFQREVNTDSGRLIHENNLDHRWRVSLNQNNFIIQTPYSNNEQQNKAIHRLHSNVDIKNDVTQKLYNNAGSQNYVLSPKPHNNVEAQNVIQQRPHNNVEPQNDVPQRPHNNAEPQNDVPQRSYNNGLIQSKFVLQRPYNNGQSQKDVVIQEPYNNDQSQDEFIQKLYNSGGLKNSFVIQKPYNNNQPQNDMFQKQYNNSGPQKEKVKMSNIEKHHLESKDRDHDYDYNGDGNEGDDQDLGVVDDNNQLIDGNQDGLDHGKVFKDADFDDQLQNNEEDEVSRDQAGHD
ncbi:GATA zinc finger domain-containing protein 14-like [Limulus polyphemus]|uniref:GATA zinc finger domain-containing protein 14-like n=1 Tax=Limulus polyphemus TaxID=6850 RepID=A0ABM1TE83_LIMPO|nr:GATA zinc finger domain-containing protein 14-like [Limulus polyphemus]